MKKAFLFPGQGSQFKGMGAGLWELFPEEVAIADRILGYSIRKLCEDDPDENLQNTQYTQPAIYTVSVLQYLKEQREGNRPDIMAGHSLGEYSALFAAGAYDFATGLRLVQERGRLMSHASEGGMAAILGLDKADIEKTLKNYSVHTSIRIANYNTPSQIVVSGRRSEIMEVQTVFEDLEGCVGYIPLRVSGAFHSPLMQEAAVQFERFLEPFTIIPPQQMVLANTTARPYQDIIKKTLVDQMTQPVCWTDSIRYMMGMGITDFKEVGPGTVLTGLVTKIKAEATPLEIPSTSPTTSTTIEKTTYDGGFSITPQELGHADFKKEYGLQYAYVTGGMAYGIASTDLVIAMAKAGFLSFFGTGGLPISEITQAIQILQATLGTHYPFGMNLVHSPLEAQTVQLYLDHNIQIIEVSAYIQASKALVRYRVAGLEQDRNGHIYCKHKLIAKISRPEVARQFLLPPPQQLVDQLLAEGAIREDQARWSQSFALADDICVEADSGGHTDQRSAFTILPAIFSLRDELQDAVRYPNYIRVGLGGGIGTPESAAAGFMLGADFILTGSINQCTVEAGTSTAVKELLATMNVQDTAYAPAGDMFELGSKIQVLKKGVFFPARANKLYELYRRHQSLTELDAKTRTLLEEKYFKKSLEEVYQEVKAYYQKLGLDFEIKNEKQKMASIFKWYFSRSSRLALSGDRNHIVDYQIWCGPALGAFNQWVKGSKYEDWQQRNVDKIARHLMEETTVLLSKRLETFKRLKPLEELEK